MAGKRKSQKDHASQLSFLRCLTMRTYMDNVLQSLSYQIHLIFLKQYLK